MLSEGMLAQLGALDDAGFFDREKADESTGKRRRPSEHTHRTFDDDEEEDEDDYEEEDRGAKLEGRKRSRRVADDGKVTVKDGFHLVVLDQGKAARRRGGRSAILGLGRRSGREGRGRDFRHSQLYGSHVAREKWTGRQKRGAAADIFVERQKARRGKIKGQS